MYKCYFKNEETINKLPFNIINQQMYVVKNIYDNMKDFYYNYIICEDIKKNIVGVMPFILYRNKYGNIIHSMPFIGYGGISAKENKKEVFTSIINYLNEFAKKENVLLITICTSPFKSNEYELYKKSFKPDFERKNFYQYLDLSENIFKNMKSKFRGNLRRNVRKCEDYGVEIFESYSKEDLLYWYNNVYVKRLTETKCSIYPYEVFDTFISKFSRDRVKMLYGKLDGKIIAGGMYFNQGISVDNFMRVVDAEYFYTQVGTMLDYYSVNYALESNVKYYNWQSCDEIGSSIYKYKEDWGSKLNYHYYITKITGDISDLKEVPIETIKQEYKGIYVMPYEMFNTK